MAKILFLTSSYPSSPEDGVCGFIDDLARALVGRHGHTVRVLTPPGKFHGFDPVDVRPVRHPWPGTRRLTADADLGASIQSAWFRRPEAVSLTLAFAAAARRSRAWADVTISHWLAPSTIAAAIAGVRPHLAVAHGGDVHLLGRMPGGSRIARFLVGRTDRIVCVSRDLESRLVEMAPRARARTTVVPMGANLGPEPDAATVRAFRATHATGTGPVILFLGRLQPIKGVDVLLDAAARLPDIDIWIAGDGPEEARLLENARAARLRVSFLGRIDRPTRRLALAACDAVVIPSRIEPNGRMEGTPVVCAESFVSGRPVIATRTGGLVEAVDDGVTGMLVPPADPEALAAAIRRFADDAELRQRLGDGVRAMVPRFEMAESALAFDRLLTELIARSSKGRRS